MPKIKTTEFWYSTEEKKDLKFKVNFRVDTSGRFYFHTAELPVEIKDMLGVVATKNDQTDCNGPQNGIDIIRKYLRQYEEFLRNKTERKVIVFEFGLNGVIREHDPDAPNYTGLKFDELSRLDPETLGLSMEWRVATEVSVGGQTQLIEDGRRDRGCEEFKRIGWTQGREDWFNKCEADLKNMLLKVHAMRSMDDEKFVTSIDQGYLLLGGPVESKDKVSKRR